jgi:hypothetical protein
MAFRSFRYHPNAEKGLLALLDRGGLTMTELKQRIQRVQHEWIPDSEEAPVYIVPFANCFLTFTVSKEDPSTLVLADVTRVA